MNKHLLHNLELVEFIRNEITSNDNTYEFINTKKRLSVSCLVAPASSTQDEVEDEIFTLYLFDKVDVDFYDEVVVRGKIGVVVGVPRLWIAPTSRRVKGQEIRVRVIANEEENCV